jgi:PAS domain S-box-containing protein
MAGFSNRSDAVESKVGRVPPCAAVSQTLQRLVTVCLIHSVPIALLLGTALGAEIQSTATNLPPKRVLILDSFGRDAAPFNSGIVALRTALARELGEPVDIYDQPLELARLVDPEAENTLTGFLERRFAQHWPDVVFPVGAPAIVFVAKYRDRLFTNTPIVFTGADQRRLRPEFFKPNTTLVSANVNLTVAIENILQVFPATTNILVIFGSSPLETFWAEECRKEFQIFAGRVGFDWMTHARLEDIENHATGLPQRSVIFFPMLVVDSAGVPYAERQGLARVRAVANAPIFGLFSSQLGWGIVGGALYPDEAVGEAAARVAVRILRGEKPEDIPRQILPPSAPTYDWRELQRWGVHEAQLPAGSIVEFRAPSVWATYQRQIVGLAGLVIAQTLLIAALLRQASQRRRAQEALDERLNIERLIADLSHVFINVRSEKLGQQIVDGLRRVGEALDFDIASFYIFTGRGTEGKLAFEWRGAGVPESAPRLFEEDFPWSAGELGRDRDIWAPALEQLPPEAQRDKSRYERYGVRSAYHVPLYAQGVLLASLNLCTVRKARELPRELLRRQRLIGEVFAGALARKLSEDRQRESDARFRIVADSAPVMIWMSGTDKLCTFFNTAWLEFTGRRLEEELGDGWVQGVHAEDLARCLKTYSAAFEARQPFVMEYRLRRKDTEYRWIEDHGVPRYDDEGNFAGYIGSCVDLTDRRKAAQEAQQQRIELAHIARLTTMGELTASLAHELTHPQSAILSNAQAGELFLNGEPPAIDEVKKILADIVRDNRRAVEIIQRLRAFLRKRELEFERVDINAVVSEIIPLVESDAGTRGVKLKLDLAPELPPARADRVHLQQVLLNLMLNGMDAMNNSPKGTRGLCVQTRLVAETANGTIEVSVMDSGSGIPAHKLATIFQPFFTTKRHGMGMGLSISRRIVEAHGGTVSAENNSGAGATIRFTLPAWNETVQS